MMIHLVWTNSHYLEIAYATTEQIYWFLINKNVQQNMHWKMFLLSKKIHTQYTVMNKDGIPGGANIG